jgi:two-component system, NarL family, nitrate/nitrite sensor histidine kinase NarX
MTSAQVNRYPNKSNSLIARAGLVMALIMALAIISLVSSMFVSDSLDGDAANINIAGSLRMQSLKISRTLLLYQQSQTQQDYQRLMSDIEQFDHRLDNLMNRGFSRDSDLVSQWQIFKKLLTDNNLSQAQQFQIVDDLVQTIEQLVLNLQRASEQKIRQLRSIQGLSLFVTLLVAFIALNSINKSIVQPMAQLVSAAKKAAHGNFETQLTNHSNDEIGLLSTTFNDMSRQLAIMHQQLEDKVEEKTKALAQSNQSLQLLYKTSQQLFGSIKPSDLKALLVDVADTLELDAVSILVRASNNDDQSYTEQQHSKANLLPSELEQYTAHLFSISVHQEELGILKVYSPLKQLDAWQQQLLESIADNFAIALSLDKKRSKESMMQLMEERAVISRELHDSLAQSLSYLKVQTRVLEKQIVKQASQQTLKETSQEIQQGLNSAYRQLRELLTTFRLQIAEPSLESALKGTVAEFTTKCAHPVELTYQLSQTQLTANQKIHLLQIIREALANVQRHAKASHCKVILVGMDNQVSVCITDDGVGLVGRTEDGMHHGINIMQERATSLNAKFSIKTLASGGTHVLLEFNHNELS